MEKNEAKMAARAKARAALRSLEPDRAKELSRLATAAFLTLPEFEDADLVLAFLSMPGEIQTFALVSACLELGKRVAVPRIEGDDLAFVLLDEDFGSWPRDRMGIPAPPAARSALSPGELGASRVLVAAPGLAFDRRGNRLGRGKGYYDRFLAAARRGAASGGGSLFACGFCYSFQLAETLPADDRDLPVDAIATDAGMIRIAPAGA
ncbi:MAG TPA: 5-formyltetrahydrofolate cyclo-ligase [Rectinemataceae bacterium]|nr:5-formyltetrahydrofolate cyclo-ligase [Rectinemataceae bacterium]